MRISVIWNSLHAFFRQEKTVTSKASSRGIESGYFTYVGGFSGPKMRLETPSRKY
jgi:Uri superfamily endonuclease